MIPLHLVQLCNIPILHQLRWEEALLRADDRNWCLINHGSPPAIVMGISGEFQALIHQDHWHSFPIPVYRRFSGGGTVVIDEDTLFVTFVFNKKDLPHLVFPEPIMRWTEELYRPLFHPHPFHLKENDYTMDSKKFGGNAQSIIKNRWLHHTSFLYKFNSHLMKYLQIPAKTPNYRQRRTHDEFLCSLSEYWPCLENLKKQLVQELGKRFELLPVDSEELNEVAALPHRKATKEENYTIYQMTPH